jgi:hypothetical protein
MAVSAGLDGGPQAPPKPRVTPLPQATGGGTDGGKPAMHAQEAGFYYSTGAPVGNCSAVCSDCWARFNLYEFGQACNGPIPGNPGSASNWCAYNQVLSGNTTLPSLDSWGNIGYDEAAVCDAVSVSPDNQLAGVAWSRSGTNGMWPLKTGQWARFGHSAGTSWLGRLNDSYDLYENLFNVDGISMFQWAGWIEW